MKIKSKHPGPPMTEEMETEICRRLREMGIGGLAAEDNKRFRSGMLLVVDGRTNPLRAGTADLPSWWLTSLLAGKLL